VAVLTPPSGQPEAEEIRRAPVAQWLGFAVAAILALMLAASLWPMPGLALAVGAPRPTALIVLLLLALGIAALAAGRVFATRCCGLLAISVVAVAGIHWFVVDPGLESPPGVVARPLIAEPWMVVLGLGALVTCAATLRRLGPYRGALAWAYGLALLVVSLIITLDGLLEAGGGSWRTSAGGAGIVIALTLAVAGALALYGWHQLRPTARIWVPGTVGLLVGLLSGLVWMGLVREVRRNDQQLAEVLAESTQAMVEELLILEGEALYRLATRIATTASERRAETFRRDARDYLADFQSLAELAWYDHERQLLVLRDPGDADEKLSFVADGDPRAAEAHRQAFASGRATFSAPLDLGKGSRGALMVVPAPIPGEGDHFLVAGIRFEELLGALRSAGGLRIVDGEEQLFAVGSPLGSAKAAFPLEAFGRQWRVEAWPPPPGRRLPRALPEIVLVCGLAAATLLAASLELARRSRLSEAQTRKHFAQSQAARQALEATERRIIQAFESTSDAVLILDSKWRFTYMNPQAEVLLRRKATSLLGKVAWDEFPEARGSGFQRTYERVIATGQAASVEEYFEPLNAWFEVRAYPHPDGVVVYFRDVSEHRRAFDRLVRSQELLARTQRVAQLGGWELDIDADRLQLTDQVFELFGLARGEAHGGFEILLDRVHPDDRSRLAEAKAATLRAEGPLDLEHRIVLRSGELRWIHERAQLSRGLDGSMLLSGTAQDISERKSIEDELRRTLDDVQDRNEELKNFAFVASHDLQEPLRKIRAFSDRLVSRAPAGLDEGAMDYLSRIGAAAGRMQRLIDDLLDYSRVTTRQRPFTAIPLGEIVSEAWSDLESRVEESCAQINIGELPVIEADRTQMQQLMQNLLGNALKFRAPGRIPRIRVWSEKAASPGPGRDLIQVFVADNGIGFDPRHAKRIFAPFQRLHGRDEYDGTGIGLAIVRRIVERHGGTVQSDGAPGAGAVFIVTLPLRQPAGRRTLQTRRESEST
jgi:PAS domain S-box-containing protein